MIMKEAPFPQFVISTNVEEGKKEKLLFIIFLFSTLQTSGDLHSFPSMSKLQ